MSWFILVIAGLLEVVWAIGLKYTHGFTRITPSIITVVAMLISVVLLSWAMKTLPVGTAYAVWTGIGAVGAAIAGIVLLGESASLARIVSLCLIVAGIIGLKISATNGADRPRLACSLRSPDGSRLPASSLSPRPKWSGCGRGSTGSRDPGRKSAHGDTLYPAR